MSSSNDDSIKALFQSEDPLINVTDFESVKLIFEIQNTTTRTEVKKDAHVELVELLERGAILEIPAKSCSRGHNLMLKVRLRKPNKQEFEFTTTAKVEAAEHFEENPEVEQVTIAFLQFDEESWQKFQKHFYSRQDEIESFLKAAKGL